MKTSKHQQEGWNLKDLLLVSCYKCFTPANHVSRLRFCSRLIANTIHILIWGGRAWPNLVRKMAQNGKMATFECYLHIDLGRPTQAHKQMATIWMARHPEAWMRKRRSATCVARPCLRSIWIGFGSNMQCCDLWPQSNAHKPGKWKCVRWKYSPVAVGFCNQEEGHKFMTGTGLKSFSLQRASLCTLTSSAITVIKRQLGTIREARP